MIFKLALCVVFVIVSGEKKNVEDLAFINIGNFTTDDCHTSVYFVSRYFKTEFQHVRSICQSFGMEVAALETKEEYENFVILLQKAKLPYPTNVMFIGAMATQTLSAFSWYWLPRGDHVDYATWWPYHPDNAGGNAYCVEFWPYNADYVLNDVSCTVYESNFVCEREDLVLKPALL